MAKKLWRKGKLTRFFLHVLLPLTAFLSLIYALISLYVAFEVMHPDLAPEVLDPSSFLLPFEEFSWKGRNDLDFSGWFIAAKKGAPVIFLCHGYGANRTRLLGLAERIYAAGLSTAVISLRGHEVDRPAASTLGWLETEDLLLARDELRSRNLVVKQKLGAWGTDIGAFAALAAALKDRDFRAVAIDSPYLSVGDYLHYRSARFAGGNTRLLQGGVGIMFSLMASGNPFEVPPRLRIGQPERDRLQIMVLISAEHDTRDRFWKESVHEFSKEEIVELPATRIDELSGPGLQAYDERIAKFFRGVSW